MNTKILETLEFNKVKALFEPHLLTEQGLEQLKELVPTDKADKIRQALDVYKRQSNSSVDEVTLQHTLASAGDGKKHNWEFTPLRFMDTHGAVSYTHLTNSFFAPLI